MIPPKSFMLKRYKSEYIAIRIDEWDALLAIVRKFRESQGLLETGVKK